ncbi:hypothetical protein P152DRAFT_5800 [Eremomyces bilateralis CBS 781.70]|uniref:Protein kinase domain-containing protein n=1 Tax=Eremomyces bilateralis CBS 781.70 TaxID=1392243 RepID=A0A6G1GGL1_9PEZI|nr:uncharacterized protein P152DRAFT_5800 [Eremomyces bilateralis CBS 781.70]KAF1817000.1 hypothetical protein P152DRAFT_5800 [Eremomyces bilateralis CBS 781.70]
MATQPPLPELVRDSRLETEFTGNIAIHRTRREAWSREKVLGHGGFGLVWLERRVDDGLLSRREAIALRAVKEIQLHRPAQAGLDYVRELQALAKFSQEKYSYRLLY